jgi:hypothetical protein
VLHPGWDILYLRRRSGGNRCIPCRGGPVRLFILIRSVNSLLWVVRGLKFDPFVCGRHLPNLNGLDRCIGLVAPLLGDLEVFRERFNDEVV